MLYLSHLLPFQGRNDSIKKIFVFSGTRMLLLIVEWLCWAFVGVPGFLEFTSL